jgi:hypothetical protein
MGDNDILGCGGQKTRKIVDEMGAGKEVFSGEKEVEER